MNMPKITTTLIERERPSLSNYCDFCNEFDAGTSNGFYARYHETPPSRIILATKNFRVFPSIGQLLEGYLLIAPLSHYKTVDEIPSELLVELVHICGLVRTVLSQIYGTCVCFEHGSRGPLNGGCGIYHAHLHMTPLAEIPDPVDILKLRFPYTELAHLNEIRKPSAGLSSYLLYQDSHARHYLFDTGPLPSQYMRKLLADALGNQDWDWRIAGREERLLATIRRLSGQFR
jgi:diadenosine tetraphosphate (Ap4A) HIT family hydrolase